MINLFREPEIKDPYMVVGWPDAGLVGIKAVSYLKEQLDAEEFAKIEPYSFFTMPQSIIKRGVLEEIEYPSNEFSFWANKTGKHDIIIFGGEQPEIKQYEFVNLILDVAEEFQVQRIYTIGGLFAHVPHTKDSKVLAVVNNSKLKRYVRRYDVAPGIDFHGTTSMNGLLIGVAKDRDIEGISLWGQVPDYIGKIPNPKIALSVLEVLTRMLKIKIDFEDIKGEAEYMEKQVNDLLRHAREQQPELDEYIKRLEEGKEDIEEGSEELLEEIENFLKENGNGQ